jgi:arsenite/tail-anchored protein-transporting ATPase
VPDCVRNLLQRLRDPDFTRIIIVTTPEATPVHEAARLQADIRRAGIEPFWWIINQSLSGSGTTDPLLQEKAKSETAFVDEVRHRHSSNFAVVPWIASEPVVLDLKSGLRVDGQNRNAIQIRTGESTVVSRQ